MSRSKIVCTASAQPWARLSGSGSRSKMVKGMDFLVRDWARVRPPTPAPIIRMCGGVGGREPILADEMGWIGLVFGDEGVGMR